MFGEEAMRKLLTAPIIISGLGGLGVEIAKNIILTGVKKVVLHDTWLTTIDAFSSQFYIEESDMDKRALVSKEKIGSLNENISVSIVTEPLSESAISQTSFWVLTDYQSYSGVIRYSTFWYENEIRFIYSDVQGVFGITFVDPSGEIKSRFLISSEVLATVYQKKCTIFLMEILFVLKKLKD